MGEFKQYFQQYREHLDTDIPPEDGWQAVKNELYPPVKIRAFARWAVAAGIVLAVSSAAFFYLRSGKEDTLTEAPPVIQPDKGPAAADSGEIEKKGMVKTTATPSLPQPVAADETNKKATGGEKTATLTRARKSPVRVAKQQYGFEGMEASYVTMIDIQMERVRTQPIYAESAEYFKWFKDQLADLDKDEANVKKQFKASVQKEELLDELMLIYQRKINVLKQLQFEINKMNNKVKQTNTGIPSEKPSYINL